jgi:hypothetical protein
MYKTIALRVTQSEAAVLVKDRDLESQQEVMKADIARWSLKWWVILEIGFIFLEIDLWMDDACVFRTSATSL